MSDISEKLYRAVLRDFDNLLDRDEELAALMESVPDYRAVHIYAQRLGQHLSSALRKNIRADVLPDGKMYYNMAEGIIRPLIENNRHLVNLSAEQVQEAYNKSLGIGLKAITPTPNFDRVDGIIGKISDSESFDDVSWMLDAPIRNITQSFVDDYILANADFHAKAGLPCKISRISSGKCCDWCESIAGTYTYGEHPANIFRRHENCDCLVLFDPGDGRGIQNSHTKKWNDPQDAAKIEARKKIGLKSDKTNKLFPINDETGKRYINHPILFEDTQFGKKIGKHAYDFGLDPSIDADREKMKSIITDIVENADERFYGEWRGQIDKVIFHIKGEDVVIENQKGEFVSVLKGGVNNARIKNRGKR